MRNKKKNRVFLLLILLLGLGIGFAALATTLKINGTAIINKSTWNIYWDNVANETGVVPATHPEITADENNVPKALLTWSVTLDEPGDYYEFEVDAVNAGTLDAEIIGIDSKYGNSSIISTVDGELVTANPNPVPSYIKYSIKYADGTDVSLGDRLEKAPDLTTTPPTVTRKTYKIRVEYDRNAITNEIINGMEDAETHTFTFNVTYGQASPLTSPWDLPEGKTADTLTVGDELCIKEQCFNFVKYDSNGDAVLLAKWNLNVDGYTTAYGGTATNLQDSNVRGEWNGTDYGRIKYASGNYWVNYSDYSIKEKYGSGYPLEMYDPDLDGAPDTETYSIAYYVKAYKNILESSSYGATIKTARLLTYTEATSTLGCTWEQANESGPCPTTGDTAFVSNTDYFLGTARNYTYVYRIIPSGRLLDEMPWSWHGVRPVIVVETSNL